MIFWIFVILLVIGLFLYFSGSFFGTNDKSVFYYCDDFFVGTGITISVLSSIILFVMLIFIIEIHLTSSGYMASEQQRYQSLIYKSKTEACRDEFGIVNKEYIDEVQRWNMDLAKYKKHQRDFWIGIFFPNIFDDFEFIDLNSIKYKE